MAETEEFSIPRHHRVNVHVRSADGTVHPSRALLVGRREDTNTNVVNLYSPVLQGADGEDNFYFALAAKEWDYKLRVIGECKDGDWRSQRDVRFENDTYRGSALFDDHGANGGGPNDSFDDLQVRWRLVRVRSDQFSTTDTVEQLTWDGRPWPPFVGSGGVDQSWVSDEDHEVAHFARKHGMTPDEVRALIKEVGNERVRLEAAVREKSKGG